jgi:hypothetical protein
MSRKTQQVYLWCLFLWTSYKPIDMVTFLYSITHNATAGGAGLHGAQTLSSDSSLIRSFTDTFWSAGVRDHSWIVTWKHCGTGCDLSHCLEKKLKLGTATLCANSCTRDNASMKQHCNIATFGSVGWSSNKIPHT